MADETPKVVRHYEVVSVESVEAPAGLEGDDWYQYVIAFEGSETIQGYQQGGRTAVTGAVKELVGQLNERHSGKRGRVNLVSTPARKPESK